MDLSRPTGATAPDAAGAPGARPRVDARAASWLIEQRARIRELELEAATLRGVLETSSRVERGVQRFCDRLEEALESARKREASLARALGYAEAQRDELARRLEAGAAEPVAALAEGDGAGDGSRAKRSRRKLLRRRG